jgi:hypothetical protein
MMSSLIISSHFAAPSPSFVFPPAGTVAWHQAAVAQLLTRSTRLLTPIKSFADDSNANESSIAKDSFETSDDELKNASDINPTRTIPSLNMGASIGAQNVGEMLFNEQLLMSGRGDVRVGPMRRWKDFRGNEIVPDNNTDGPN